jgi:Putative DNA-binding domain
MSNATTLAQQQRDLLNAIYTTNTIAINIINTLSTDAQISQQQGHHRGLKAYKSNATASAQRSLKTAYPVIAQLIGSDAFDYLALDFWAQHPPMRGDLAQWGSELAEFITTIPALQTEPFLSDVAKAEWALHTAATATDQAADLATFVLLTEQDANALTLQLAPGTALIHSSYPIASVMTAHLYAAPSFVDVGQKLRQTAPEIALVWRQGLRPMVASCTTGEAGFISHLQAGKSLLAAIEATSADDSANDLLNFDFNIWLSKAVQSGLLLNAHLL